jgi:hypothetical protein
MIIKFTKETDIHSHRTEASSRYPENINEALGYDLTDKHTTPYGGVVKPATCITVMVENP